MTLPRSPRNPGIVRLTVVLDSRKPPSSIPDLHQGISPFRSSRTRIRSTRLPRNAHFRTNQSLVARLLFACAQHPSAQRNRIVRSHTRKICWVKAKTQARGRGNGVFCGFSASERSRRDVRCDYGDGEKLTRYCTNGIYGQTRLGPSNVRDRKRQDSR